MTAEVSLEPQKSKKSHMSLFFLGGSIVLTLALYFYNTYLVNDSNALKTQITSIEGNITELQKDTTLSLFSLLQVNKKNLDLLATHSKVTSYMDHIKYISRSYDLHFIGFNISGTTINTMVAALSDEKGGAYKKVSTFIEKYNADPKALFHLNFIDRFSGYDDMRFNVAFQIK